MATVTTRFEGGCTISNPDRSSSGESYSGNGIFTTTITERNALDIGQVIRIRALAYHLERLLGSAQRRFVFGIDHLKHHPEHAPEWLSVRLVQLTKDFHASVETSCAKLRITVDEKGTTVLQEPWAPRWDCARGIRLRTVAELRPAPEVKNADTAVCIRAANEAQRFGADEALLISPQDIVAEGCWSNFFWFDQQGDLITPKTLLLPGVTRRIILEQEPCDIRDATLSEILDSAAEAFVTQATHGIAPVISIDEIVIGDGIPGEHTTDLMTRFYEYQKRYDTIIPFSD